MSSASCIAPPAWNAGFSRHAARRAAITDRVRAHILLCMLAYYVEWHMRQQLAPLLFDDHDPQAAPYRL